MYKKFYGLTRNPFEISPDPYFLFPTARHNEALASICHGVLRHKGFIVVTGEVGTGKTLLVRCLLELLRRQHIASANVFNPCLSPMEFLRYIAGDLGLKIANQDKGTLLLELNNFLIGRYRSGLTTVLIVDEAQHLEPELLEEIRLLTNLETSQQKLLQIVLVGQPELDLKMDSVQLRQLKQRIAMRCQLEPLDDVETRGYILRRLDRAGANSHSAAMFPDTTVASVYRYSRGIPRLINTICENALIAAYAQKLPQVSAEIVDEVARDLRLTIITTAPTRTSDPASDGPRVIAKSLLELIETLERVARGAEIKRNSSDVGVKIV
jgi:general secretion pathway protein A